MSKNNFPNNYASLKDFTSITAHQLRSPLSVLRWLVKMLIDGEKGRLNKGQRELSEKVYQLLDQLVLMVNFLLQIGRVESGRLKIFPEPMSLTSFVQEIVEILEPQIQLKRLRFSFKTEPLVLPSVMADREVLWQVLQNLLSNAVVYSSKGEKIEIYIRKKVKFLECSVKDFGIGIPKNEQAKVFEKFFRAQNAVKNVPTGTGLGLALTKVLVELWGGKIWFVSKEKKGSTFFFTIPLSGMKLKPGEISLRV